MNAGRTSFGSAATQRRGARWRAPAAVALAFAVALAGAALAGGAGTGRGTVASAAEQRPNVLLLITDDQRDRGGSMGAMPKTRSILAPGTRFPNAFVTTPQCCPSRASIYSGQYVHNHHVRANRLANDFDLQRSWPHELRQAGYETVLYGKFLNEWQGDAQIFSEWREREPGDYPPGPPGHDLWLADRASGYIEEVESRPGDQPWALVASFLAPHSPFVPEERYEDAPVGKLPRNPAMAERDFSDKNPLLRRAQSTRFNPAAIRAGQLRMLMTTDDAIARIWNVVEAAGAAEETLVIFISDNGYYWGEHRLRGKFLPYLDSLRVPLYVRWDGHTHTSTDTRFALNIDLATTIYDATGIDPAYEPDGRSLLDPDWDRRWLRFEGPASFYSRVWPQWRDAYYDGRRHYIRWSNGFQEYYDLRRDPHALRSLLSPSRPRAKRMRAARRVRPLQRLLRRTSACVGPVACP